MYTGIIYKYAPLPMNFRWLDLAILLWIGISLLRGIRLPRLSDAHGVYGMIILFLFLTVAVTLAGIYGGSYSAGELMDGVAPSIRTLLYCSTVWLAYDTAMRKEISFSFLIKAFIILGLPHFAYGVIQFISLNTGLIPYSSLPYQPERIQASGELEYVKHSVTGFTDAPFSFSSWGGLTAILCFGLLLHGKDALKFVSGFKFPPRLLLWMGYLTGMGMVAMSYRRTALIASITAMLLMAVMKVLFSPTPNRRSKGLSVVLVSVVLITIGMTWMSSHSEALQNRMYSLVSLASGQMDDPRLQNLEGRSNETWGFWIELFQERPMGVGLYAPAIYNVGSDNSYLTYLAQGGLLYAASYISILVSLFVLGFRYMRHYNIEISASGLALCGVVIYICIAGMGTGGSLASQTWQMRWLFIGAFLAMVSEVVSEQNGDGIKVWPKTKQPGRKGRRMTANKPIMSKRGEIV
jgi:hypothetical protein